jgi:3-phenylpropionate/trans-cinnamate dioxygenase ferredoxin reductase subunit
VIGRADRIVIVGAGLAGANAAVTLREEGFAGRVVLIGNEAGVPFGRPPLSKTYLRSEEDLSGWYVKPPEWYDRNDIERRTETVVQHVDIVARAVLLDGDECIAYDRLALCTGGRPRRPAISGIGLPGVHVLRTVADCDAIKSAARPGARAVVVGMGFIGSEVAASLRQLGLHVSAVLTNDGPLESVLGKEVGAVMADVHREHGVELVTSDRVVAFEGADVLERVVTEHGRRLDCDLAVVGAGIEPNLDAIATTPIATDNGILVDEHCRTNVAGVQAAGDCANHLHPLFGRIRVEHYNNGEKMGRYVARSMLGDEAPYDYVHTFWSDQYEHSLEYVGHVAQWDELVFRGSLEERSFVGFYLRGGVVRAAVGLGRGGDPELDEDGEMYACKQLVAAQAALSKDVLVDEAVDLRSLALTPRSRRGPGPRASSS